MEKIMQIEKLNIFPQDPNANLVAYVSYNSKELNRSPRPAIIVCPGGGYGFLSDRESEPIALAFLAQGFAPFVLNYSVREMAADYNPVCEAALAIKHVRENAEKYNVDAQKVFIVGFSAGGHVAASAGTLWSCDRVRAALGEGAPEGIGRPDGMILAYPVISAFDHPHDDSFFRLCGTNEPTDAQKMEFSLEHHVDGSTAPAFIWHTFEDTLVPVYNSLCFAKAMKDKGVHFEMHIYPYGPHGLALANKETWSGWENMIQDPVVEWVSLAARWARSI